MIEILNICLNQNSIFIEFFKILKIHEIFCENPRIIFVLFYDVHKENMFTINLEDASTLYYINGTQLKYCACCCAPNIASTELNRLKRIWFIHLIQSKN